MRIRHGLKLDEPNDFEIGGAGRDPARLGSDQPGDVPGAGRHLLDRADGRRHRRDGDHDDLGDRADARDRRAQGARRAAAGDPVSVPGRGRRADLDRRYPGHPVRQRHRPRRSVWPPASPSRCRGGRSRSASASRPASASSSAWCRPSAPRASIRSRRCATSRAAGRGLPAPGHRPRPLRQPGLTIPSRRFGCDSSRAPAARTRGRRRSRRCAPPARSP